MNLTPFGPMLTRADELVSERKKGSGSFPAQEKAVRFISPGWISAGRKKGVRFISPCRKMNLTPFGPMLTRADELVSVLYGPRVGV